MSNCPQDLAARDHMDDIIGKGKGDPDIYGYPGDQQ